MSDERFDFDASVLADVIHAAMFAADSAALDAMSQVSSVRRPDGGPQGLTKAEETRVAVAAAIEYVVGVRMVTLVSREDLDAIFGEGVPMRVPDWMHAADPSTEKGE